MLLALPRPGPWHMFGFGGVEMTGKMWLFAFIEHKIEVDESMKGKVWDFFECLMIFDDDYEHKICFGLADFLCERKSVTDTQIIKVLSSKIQRVK